MPDTTKTKLGTAKIGDILAIELKRAREAKGLTHTQLNKMTGISRSVLFGYETGRTKPGAREIRVLCETLEINPNRLLFGSEEPFKPRTGLRGLVKLRGAAPVVSLVIGIFAPVLLAALHDEELEALLTIASTLIEARDKDLYRKLSAFAEVFLENAGDLSQDRMSDLLSRAKDPAFINQLNTEIEQRIKKYERQ